MKNCLYLLALISLCASARSIVPANSELDNWAQKAGTDKRNGPNGHNYANVYNIYFSPLKDAPINFLEIGFSQGASAHMWDHYFSRANLYFMDINPECRKHFKGFSNRAHLHIADQANEQQLLEFMRQVNDQFDIIIDDGGHTMEQQLVSFETLFPHVRPGGIYIIEDLHTSYWYEYGNGNIQSAPGSPASGPHSMTDVLKSLVDAVNYYPAYTQFAVNGYKVSSIPAELQRKLTYYQKHILSVHFYPSLCFVFKKEE